MSRDEIYLECCCGEIATVRFQVLQSSWKGWASGCASGLTGRQLHDPGLRKIHQLCINPYPLKPRQHQPSCVGAHQHCVEQCQARGIIALHLQRSYPAGATEFGNALVGQVKLATHDAQPPNQMPRHHPTQFLHPYDIKQHCSNIQFLSAEC